MTYDRAQVVPGRIVTQESLGDRPDRAYGEPGDMVAPSAHLPDVIHQATGMISVQLGCDPAEALGRLRIRCDASNFTLEDFAHLVVDRIVQFDN
jgi:hypothetical protein